VCKITFGSVVDLSFRSELLASTVHYYKQVAVDAKASGIDDE
jgi:hypothetical protein